MSINICTFGAVNWWSWCLSGSSWCPSSCLCWFAEARGRSRKNQTGILNSTAAGSPPLLLENWKPLSAPTLADCKPTKTSVYACMRTQPTAVYLQSSFSGVEYWSLLHNILTCKINFLACRRSGEQRREWEGVRQFRSEARFQRPPGWMVSPGNHDFEWMDWCQGGCCQHNFWFNEQEYVSEVLPAYFSPGLSFLELHPLPHQPRPPATLSA